jgi:hypothetical protein
MDNYTIEKVVESGETFYIYNELENNKSVYLNSTFSAEKESGKFVEQIKSDQLNIVIGIGNGTFVKQLCELDFVHCLIIEPFEDVEIDESTDNTIKIHENISYYYYKDISTLLFNEYIKKFMGLNVNIIIHPRYEKTNKALISETVKTLKNGTMIAQVNKNTEKLFKKDWVIEPLINLKYTLSLPSINELYNKFEGETAFLVASGPSLKENIPVLEKMKNKAFIFAVGSALNGLLSNNIVPDYVTVIDSGIKNYTTHFKGINYTGPLILSGMLNSNILKNHKGSAILANLDIDSITTRFRDDVAVFPTVPSVAVYTLQLLYYLGFSKVYLVGQDLALLNGEYYAKGIKLHQSSNNFESDLHVESNNGSKVGTSYSLYTFLQSFNDLIPLMDKEKMQIYNLSKDGAKIKDVEYVTSDSIKVLKEKKHINIEYINNNNTDKNVAAIKEFIFEIKDVQLKVDELLNRLNKINVKTVTLKDLKKVLKIFKELRSQKIIEDIFLKQLSFYVRKINNKFEYTFEKDIVTNKDRIEMVKDIIHLVEEIQKYFKEVLDDDRIANYLN